MEIVNPGSESNGTAALVFAHNLKTARRRAGLTQVELGQRARIGSTVISHFEHGHTSPRLDALVRIADALETPIATLVAGTSRYS